MTDPTSTIRLPFSPAHYDITHKTLTQAVDYLTITQLATNPDSSKSDILWVDSTGPTLMVGTSAIAGSGAGGVTLAGAQTITGVKTFSAAPIISTITNTGTLTLPTTTDTLVGKATTDILTNKTLTLPVISSIVNTGTLTLPTATTTLIGTGTSDILTNKTITSATNNVATDSLKTTGASVDVAAAAPPISGKVLTATSATTATWQTPSAATGDVVGPASATSGDVVSFNGTTGKLVQDSGKLAANLVTGPASATASRLCSFNGTTGKIIKDSGLDGTLMAIGDSLGSVAGDVVTFANADGITLKDLNYVNIALGALTINAGYSSSQVLGVNRNNTGFAGDTLTVTSGGCGIGSTNLNGGDLILASGISTGTGKGNVRLQTATGSSTGGTTSNTVVDRLVIAGRKALTSATLATIATPTVAASDAASFVITYGIRVTGSGDVQSETGSVMISMVNKAGTFTSTVTAATPVQALSSGTLSTTWSVTAAGIIQVTSTTSLGTPTMSICCDIKNHSGGAFTF